MRLTRSCHERAFTLLELSLVIGILAVLCAMIIPTFNRQLREDELPRSARQFRSLITLVRANAAFDSKRYRIRFPAEDELDPLGGENQPIIEREDDPLGDPEVFNLVIAPWAVDAPFQGEVWCAEVALGRPSIEQIRVRRERVAETITQKLRETFQDFDPYKPPLYVEPDGSCEWATFALTTAPRRSKPNELKNFPRLDLILDGGTGMAWLQRPFYEEELDLFEEKNWPSVLRQDFLDARELTEDDVLEIRESQLQGAEVQVQGNELKVKPQGQQSRVQP